MTPQSAHIIARRLHVRGIVQGVGFRPCVYNLATSCGLAGWVLNATDGVHIHIEGASPQVDGFAELLRTHAPKAARIEGIDLAPAEPEGFAGFEIRVSDADAPAATLVSPDLATCDDCLAELFDPANRRYRYPFINCTSCGPRFTIIDALPYDRPATSMRAFEMCPACAREYADPANRRFHAQPDACFECGPQLTFTEFSQADALPEGDARTRSDAIIARTAELLRTGRIVAIKGLGGFHLACDATSDEAVSTLRERKRRPKKPLAVMYPSIEAVERAFAVPPEERELLTSPARPIVLLRGTAPELSAGIACELAEVGVMLPSTPLQHLLLAEIGGTPLVMTSGNISGDPIVTTDEDAICELRSIADAVLGNDRPIRSRYDDSVVRVVDGATQVVRRARGYAPQPIALPCGDGAPRILACGPEQKATIALTRGREAFVSQHIGDLESAATFAAWVDACVLYQRLFDIKPEVIVCDKHPEYLSSKWAHSHAEELGLPLIEVQHHHAHIAAVTGEHGVSEPVLGLALDGTGFGDDGTIWGGELLVCDWRGYERVGRLRTLPMPGGAAAIRQPSRMAAGALLACGLENHQGALDLRERLGELAWGIVSTMIERGVNTPQTSSAGRLLDAVSALIGICDEATYDGEPAISLEAAAAQRPVDFSRGYEFTLSEGELLEIDPTPALAALLDDLVGCVASEIIAARFLDGFAHALIDATERAAHAAGLSTVALGGGVFMNRRLLSSIKAGLSSRGLTVLTSNQLPPNDGCIAYGQAIIAAHSEKGL